MIGLIVIFSICLMLSAAFSASEVAFSSSNVLLLTRIASQEKPSLSDKIACRIATNFRDYLPTILLGNNLVNTAIASIATQMTFASLPADRSGMTWIGTAITTLIVIIFCETIPKIIARSKSISISKALGIPLWCLHILLYPLASIINAITKFAGNRHKNEEPSDNINADEITLAIEEIRESGEIDTQEEELLVNSIDFDDTCVFEIATHRMDIDGIDPNDEVRNILKTAIETRYSRLIVYEKSRDFILGIIFTKSILKFFAKNPNPTKQALEKMVETEMFSPLYIHMTMDLNDCLALMKKEKKHLAIINDEYGGTYGIVTMEDILENVSGEIWDESDKIESDVEKKSDNLYYVKGDLEIENLLDALDVDNGEEYAKEIESTSIGGLAFEMLDRLPKKGDSFIFAGFRFIVFKMDGRRVAALHARRLKRRAPGPS